jgi:hypothetical protein
LRRSNGPAAPNNSPDCARSFTWRKPQNPNSNNSWSPNNLPQRKQVHPASRCLPPYLRPVPRNPFVKPWHNLRRINSYATCSNLFILKDLQRC